MKSSTVCHFLITSSLDYLVLLSHLTHHASLVDLLRTQLGYCGGVVGLRGLATGEYLSLFANPVSRFRMSTGGYSYSEPAYTICVALWSDKAGITFRTRLYNGEQTRISIHRQSLTEVFFLTFNVAQ
jgi:hypothetical protein